MTGMHIRKRGDGEWEYPDQEKALEECGLFPIEIYLQRRRGTLRKYLEGKKELWKRAIGSGRHCRDGNKILWWDQEYLTKETMEEKFNFWFR